MGSDLSKEDTAVLGCRKLKELIWDVLLSAEQGVDPGESSLFGSFKSQEGMWKYYLKQIACGSNHSKNYEASASNKGPIRTIALFVGQLTLSTAHRARGEYWALGPCLCIHGTVLAPPSVQPCSGNQTQPPQRPAPCQDGSGIILYERASSGPGVGAGINNAVF